MKTIIILVIGAVLFTACQREHDYNGKYVAHIKGEYSIADDTLVLQNDVVINTTGYQKIRNGKALPRAYMTHSWTVGSLNAPVMQISRDRIIIGKTTYHKIQ